MQTLGLKTLTRAMELSFDVEREFDYGVYVSNGSLIDEGLVSV